MKKLLLFVMVVLVIAAVFWIPTLTRHDADWSDNTFDDPIKSKADHAIELLSGSGKWTTATRKGADTILNYINAAKKAGGVDTRTAEEMSEYLYATYIPMVVKAAEEYFDNNCNPPTFLSGINAELKRYSDYSRNKDHKRLADNMRRYTSGVYYVKGWVDKDGIRKGLDQDVKDYIGEGRFDLNQAKALLRKLNQYQNLKYLKDCAMVNASIRKNRKRLSDFHLNQLKTQVDKYTVNINNYDEEKTAELQRLLDEYIATNYLENDQTKKNAQPLFSQLDKMYYDYERKKTNKNE